ncbi:hypothetical protein E4U32_002590 [Claviceps aff. humidiphila group G2b]|nr:hypothetical protein E4U32_002590 [Claviceps aff. humidiphila group G2b]
MAQPRLPLITILGSLNMDLVSYVPHHPLPGETLTSSSFNTSPGGKGANQAVACAKLSRSQPNTTTTTTTTTDSSCPPSAQVNMLGAIGNDTHGQTLLTSLHSYGVNTNGIRTLNNLSTGLALIIVDEPSGQNRIILSPEANHALRPEDFTSAASFGDATSGLLPDLLILQLEIPLETVLQALRTAKKDGVPVLLNPAPAQIIPGEAYEGLAHLIVNETEACVLSGRGEDELETAEGLASVADEFLERGVQNVVITLGGRGVYYAARDGPRALVEALKADVVDTTAAGDTFVGSYALAVVQAREGDGFDIDAAIRAANRASAITVSRKGAQVSIPWRDELQ